MSNIKPVSDLINYNEVLQCVTNDSPVYLTKNGHKVYTILTMENYDHMVSTLRLYSELNKGLESAKREGWLDSEDVEKELREL